LPSALLRIEQAGPLTTIQDRGRPGWARYGIPTGGPIDSLSFAAANAALGNPPDRAIIEFSFGGMTLECIEGAVGFALTGGGMVAPGEAHLGGAWLAGDLVAGERLTIRAGPEGNWGYLAFAGALDAPLWLGGRGAHAPSGLGGGTLRAGSMMKVEGALALGGSRRLSPLEEPPPSAAIRVVPGPQDRFFDPAVRARLFTEPFALTAAMDRMGAVLSGPNMAPARIDMLSQPAMRGCLQVDGTGRTTLLLSDYQTTGGYPKIGTVVAPDVDRLAQLPPGRAFRFVAITPAEAIMAHRQSHERRTRYLSELGRSDTLEERLWRSNLIGGVVSAAD
jgi:biotin-dependent carboxylase-like uncharacterized protein